MQPVAVMSKEDLQEGLRDLERQQKPGNAAAQLREIEAEITFLLGKGYTLQQVWRGLTERGLKLSFSGFKSSIYRMQKEAAELQKVSNSFDECPHCGGALTNGDSRIDTGSAGAETVTNAQPTIAAEGQHSSENAAGRKMGETFARALLEKGMLPAPVSMHKSKP